MSSSGASLSWIDYDSAEKERMQRVLALFRERNTVDELGMGAIRDTLADRLMPGTSTIQTRLRYFLFVPWMYRELEREHVPSARIERAGRDYELRLLDALVGSDNVEGVFGISAGRTIKRLPSEVYWSGLGSWGLRRFPGSQQDYFRELDSVYARRRRARGREEAESEWTFASDTWHPDLPPPPAGFPDDVGMALRREEAVFLQDCIVKQHGETLLATLSERAGEPIADVDFPWMHPDLGTLSDEQQTLLYHGRLFSEVMNGASRLYNLALAEHAGRAELAAEHRDGFSKWVDSIEPEEVRSWSLDEFWPLVLDRGHRITPTAQRFVTQWVGEVTQGTGDLADRLSARHLVRVRERQMKGPRSRFANQRALDQWGGYSGLQQMDFRWRIVRTLLRDLHAGIHSDV